MHSDPVAVFWDYGTTPLKKGVSGQQIVKALREVGLTHGPIKSFRAYVDYDCQKRASFMTFRHELHSSGVSLVDCPSTEKDLADKTIIVDMMALAWDHPPPYTFILATSDSDLSYALAILRFRGYKIIVVCPSDSNPLAMQSNFAVNWNRRVLGLEDEGGDDGSSETSSSSTSSSEGEGLATHNNRISGQHDPPTHVAALADTPDDIEVRPVINSSTSRTAPVNERQTHQDIFPEVALSQEASHPLRTGVARDTPINSVVNSTKKATSQHAQSESEAQAERKGAKAKCTPLSPSPPPSISNQGNGFLRENASVSDYPPPFTLSLNTTPRMSQFPNSVQHDSLGRDHVSSGESSSDYSLISQPTNVASSGIPENLVAPSTLKLPEPLAEEATVPLHPIVPSHIPIPASSSQPTNIQSRPGSSNPQPVASGSFNPSSTTHSKPSNSQPTPTSTMPTPPRPGPSTPSVPAKRKLPDQFNALVKCLQNHRAQGRYTIDPGILAAELKPKSWKRKGYTKFKQYAAEAVQKGIIIQNSDKSKHIQLRPEWYDVKVP